MQENILLNIDTSSSIHPTEQEPLSLDAGAIDNVVLKRLIEEVQFDKENNINAYNRTHNRHNRGR